MIATTSPSLAHLLATGELLCPTCLGDAAGGDEASGEAVPCERCLSPVRLPHHLARAVLLARHLRYHGLAAEVRPEGGGGVLVPFVSRGHAHVTPQADDSFRFELHGVEGNPGTPEILPNVEAVYQRLLAAERHRGRLGRLRMHEARNALWLPRWYS